MNRIGKACLIGAGVLAAVGAAVAVAAVVAVKKAMDEDCCGCCSKCLDDDCDFRFLDCDGCEDTCCDDCRRVSVSDETEDFADKGSEPIYDPDKMIRAVCEQSGLLPKEDKVEEAGK